MRFLIGIGLSRPALRVGNRLSCILRGRICTENSAHLVNESTRANHNSIQRTQCSRRSLLGRSFSTALDGSCCIFPLNVKILSSAPSFPKKSHRSARNMTTIGVLQQWRILMKVFCEVARRDVMRGTRTLELRHLNPPFAVQTLEDLLTTTIFLHHLFRRIVSPMRACSWQSKTWTALPRNKYLQRESKG